MAGGALTPPEHLSLRSLLVGNAPRPQSHGEPQKSLRLDPCQRSACSCEGLWARGALGDIINISLEAI